MAQNYHFELVSLKICPYVQRSVIMLLHKKVPYDITYIDLYGPGNPPEWFKKISPLGQVPLLKVNRETVIFESTVINEFLDEVAGLPLHPRDPVHKARERAWMEYANELFRESFMIAKETDKTRQGELKDEFFTDLARLEDAISPQGPYFRGKEFGMVDATYAPLFVRMELSELVQDPRWKKLTQVTRWAHTLCALPEVKSSVVPEFKQLYLDFVRELREEG